MGISQRNTTGDLIGIQREITHADTAIAASAGATIDIAFTGAELQSVVTASWRAALSANAAVILACPPRVESAGVVRFVYRNLSTDAATIAAATIDCAVQKY